MYAQFLPGLEPPPPPPPPPAPPPPLPPPPPLFGYPPLSEANFKNYPLFLTAIQIGACKLYEAL